MRQSILNGKSILAIDDEPDVVSVLEEEIRESCSSITFRKAGTFE